MKKKQIISYCFLIVILLLGALRVIPSLMIMMMAGAIIIIGFILGIMMSNKIQHAQNKQNKQNNEDEEKDKCQFCLGAKGGKPGNENFIDGVIICDYCYSLLQDIEAERDRIEEKKDTVEEN